MAEKDELEREEQRLKKAEEDARIQAEKEELEREEQMLKKAEEDAKIQAEKEELEREEQRLKKAEEDAKIQAEKDKLEREEQRLQKAVQEDEAKLKAAGAGMAEHERKEFEEKWRTQAEELEHRRKALKPEVPTPSPAHQAGSVKSTMRSKSFCSSASREP